MTPEELLKLSEVRAEFDAGNRLSNYRGIQIGVPTSLLKLSDIRGLSNGGGGELTACEQRGVTAEVAFRVSQFADVANWETFTPEENYWWVTYTGNSDPQPFTGTFGAPVTNDPVWSIVPGLGEGLQNGAVSIFTNGPTQFDSVNQYWVDDVHRYYPGTVFDFECTISAGGGGEYAECGILYVLRDEYGDRVFDYGDFYEATNGTTNFTGSYADYEVPSERNGWWVDYVVPFFGTWRQDDVGSVTLHSLEISNVRRDITCPGEYVEDEFAAYVKMAGGGEIGFTNEGQYSRPNFPVADFWAFAGYINGNGGNNNPDPLGQDWGQPSRFITDEHSKFGTKSLNFNNVLLTNLSNYGFDSYFSSPIEYAGNLSLYYVQDEIDAYLSGSLDDYDPGPYGSDEYYRTHPWPIVGRGDFTIECWCRSDYQLQRYSTANPLYTGSTPENFVYADYLAESNVAGRAALFTIGPDNRSSGFDDPNDTYNPVNIEGTFGSLLVTDVGELYWAKGEYDANSATTLGRNVLDFRDRISCGIVDIRDGDWHFVSVTRKDLEVFIHVDGELKGQGIDGRYIKGTKTYANTDPRAAFTTIGWGSVPAVAYDDAIWGDHRTPLETIPLSNSNGLYPESDGGAATWQGQLDEVRYTCGLARYTDEDYPVPTSGSTPPRFVNNNDY